MIKATKKDKTTPKQPKYPCLMESTDGTIVLMTEHTKGTGTGMVVHGEGRDKYSTEGSYLGGWLMGYFKPYDGKIILENK